MQVELTPEQDDIVRHAIASGRTARPEGAVAKAMADWVGRERERSAFIARLDEADASDARGESISIESDEELDRVADEIKAECRSRLEAGGGTIR